MSKRPYRRPTLTVLSPLDLRAGAFVLRVTVHDPKPGGRSWSYLLSAPSALETARRWRGLGMRVEVS